MELREPTAADGERIAELVDSAFTTSYRLSPGQIDQISSAAFAEDAIEEKVADDSTVVRVAETEPDEDQDVEGGVVVGYAEGDLEESNGVLRWLFVDPEHRGKGIGEQLFQTGSEALRETGAEELRAATLEANAEGQDFFDHLGYEHVEDREVEIADQSLVEHVYAEPSADTDQPEEGEEREDVDAMDLPDTETEEGVTTARTDDGERLYVALEERESGTEAPFFVTYLDEDHSDQHGYYCANCGSVDVVVDTADRLECSECGNDHASRSGKAYDDSYL